MLGAKRKKQIPNFITVGRIGIALVVIVLYFVGFYINRPTVYQILIPSFNLKICVSVPVAIGGGLFLIGATTDWIDGYLARKWNAVSDFGKFLDPVADKILVNGVLIVLAVNREIAIAWVVLLFIVRDTVVDAIRMYCSTRKLVIDAGWFGKWKTFFQMLGILVLSFVFYVPSNQYQTMGLWFYYLVQNGLLLVAGVLALISGFEYFLTFYKRIRINEFQK